jgi:probable phosphoglycerate mutase
VGLTATLAPVPTGPATNVLVVRHGQTEWNRIGRWQGHADIALDEVGRRQALLAAESVGAVDAIFASDLQRAATTAEIIAHVIGIGPVRLDSRLREHDVGPWEGLSSAEVEQRWPGYLAQRLRPAGFEPLADAGLRMIGVIREIAATHPGCSVLVVSHGGALRALVEEALGVHGGAPGERRAPVVGNLGGFALTVAADGSIDVGPVVDLLGDDRRALASEVL